VKQLHTKPRFEESLQYGVRAGFTEVRQEVAKFLTRQYETSVDWYIKIMYCSSLIMITQKSS